MAFANNKNLFVQQTRKGCFRNLLGCEAKAEFNIATIEKPTENIFYAHEESSCCMRMLCPACNPFTIEISEGGSAGGKKIVDYYKPMRAPLANCKCCCFQEIESKVGGQVIGGVREAMWFCIPMYNVYKADKSTDYVIHTPTCFGGVCPNVCAEGCCVVPFYVYSVKDGKKSEESHGKINKVWGGAYNELVTQAHKFQVTFPDGADNDAKTRILGATFLINENFFKAQGDQK